MQDEDERVTHPRGVLTFEERVSGDTLIARLA